MADLRPSPVIALNRAIAHGYAYGPVAGLDLLDAARAGGGLDSNPLALAVEADLVARQGDRSRAAGLFRQAAATVGSAVERRALLDRADELSPYGRMRHPGRGSAALSSAVSSAGSRQPAVTLGYPVRGRIRH
ncbi:hypothetical protein [Micromonospora sp. NPDC049645]|uniref:hypothetical protein n=1 Tax=Micromonospora sp. NPDC049645 TaxID=3155508 RepID=UPI003432E09B